MIRNFGRCFLLHDFSVELSFASLSPNPTRTRYTQRGPSRISPYCTRHLREDMKMKTNGVYYSEGRMGQ